MSIYRCVFRIVMFFPGIPNGFTTVVLPSGVNIFLSLHTTKMNWNDATSYCRSLDQYSHLVAIGSAEAQKAVNDFVKGRYTI